MIRAKRAAAKRISPPASVIGMSSGPAFFRIHLP
jgi:hypothetical protein